MNTTRPARQHTKNRAHNVQLDALLDYMVNHTEFARGHITNLGASGKLKHKEMWEQLSDRLNEIGPVTKDAAAWSKTWNTLKSSAKKKKAAYTVATNKTGNVGPIEPLSDFEACVSAIFGKYGNGLSVIEEIGRRTKTQDAIEVCEVSDEENCEYISSPVAELTYNLQYLEYQMEKDSQSLGKVLNYLKDVLLEFVTQLDCLITYRGVKKPKNRSNVAQKVYLIDFMKKYPQLASEKHNDDPQSAGLWVKLTDELNCIPEGIVKDKRSWMKSWSDLVRGAHARRKQVQAGQRKALVAHDQRVIDLTPNFCETETNCASTTPYPSDVLHRSRSRSPQRYGHGSPKRFPGRHLSSSPQRHGEYSERSRHGSPKHTPKRNLSYSPKRHGEYSERSRHGSPKHSPNRNLSCSPQRHGEYSERSRHGSPKHSPKRNLSYSPKRHGEYSERSRHGSTKHSPKRQLTYSPQRHGEYSGRSHHGYSKRSSGLLSQLSTTTLPSQLSTTTLPSQLSTTTLPSQRCTTTLPSQRCTTTLRSQRATDQLSTQQEKPLSVQFVDLTEKKTPDSRRRTPLPTTATGPATVPTKGAGAGASAILSAMDQYTSKVNGFVDKIVERIDTQNTVLKEGLDKIAKVVSDAVRKIFAGVENQEEPKAEQNHQQEAETETYEDGNFDDERLLDPPKEDLMGDDDEEEWETEFLDDALLPDDKEIGPEQMEMDRSQPAIRHA